MLPRDLHSNFDRDPAAGSQINRGVTVTTTSAKVVEQNRLRKKILFINIDGAETVWLAKGSGPAVASNCIYLSPGASYEDLVDALGYIFTGPYHAVSGAGTPILVVLEEG